MSTLDTFAGAAEFYASRGLPVFPLKPGQKVPATLHGKDDATTDVAHVRAWWTSCPDFNVAIRPPEGMIVLDVDPRNGGKLTELGMLPRTLVAETGGGGWHLWFRHTRPVRGRVADSNGIDIKSHSGYLVAPPSIHPDTGRPYRWADRSAVAVLPPKLHRRVERPKPRVRPHGLLPALTGDRLTAWLAASVEGERNNRLFWAACRAVESGADPLDLLPTAVGLGLDEKAAEATILSAIKTPARS